MLTLLVLLVLLMVALGVAFVWCLWRLIDELVSPRHAGDEVEILPSRRVRDGDLSGSASDDAWEIRISATFPSNSRENSPSNSPENPRATIRQDLVGCPRRVDFES